MNTFELLDKYEPKSMHDNLPVIWDKAKDCYVWDKEGNKYLDFTSGIFVANVGHSNEKVIKAIKSQLKKVLHSYTFATEIRAKLLEKLCSLTGYENAFLLSTGAEAVECAIKLISNYGKTKENARYIISFKGSMHGKTWLTECLKGTYQNESIITLPFPEKDEQFIPLKYHSDILGIIIESYQGWSARLYPTKYIQDLCEWAKKNKILVCFDEIQSGIGRTGKLFCYEHYKVKPDLVCISKGLGGGLPISAVLGRKELFQVDDLSSTQSGNPVCCASALATLEELEKILPVISFKNVILYGGLVHLKYKYTSIKEINSIGLVGAIIFNSAEQANKVIYRAFEKGLLLVKTGRESIKIGPPLTIPTEKILEGINIINNSIKETLEDK